MPAKILAFPNQKGGVGKTTLAVMTACWLAQHERKRVLVVDMDAQGSASSFFVGRENLDGTQSDELFEDALAEIKPQTVELEPPLAVYKRFFDAEQMKPATLDLIGSGSIDGSGYDTESLPLEQVHNPARHIRRLAENYDFIIIDCPPSLGRRLVATIIAAQYVACPMKLSGSAIEGLELLMHSVAAIKKKYNPRLKLLGFIINEFRPIASNKMTLEDLQASSIQKLLFQTCMRHSACTDMAMTKGLPLWCTLSAFRAIELFQNLMQEIDERISRR